MGDKLTSGDGDGADLLIAIGDELLAKFMQGKRTGRAVRIQQSRSEIKKQEATIEQGSAV